LQTDLGTPIDESPIWYDFLITLKLKDLAASSSGREGRGGSAPRENLSLGWSIFFPDDGLTREESSFPEFSRDFPYLPKISLIKSYFLSRAASLIKVWP
jgi:hypothetical protein